MVESTTMRRKPKHSTTKAIHRELTAVLRRFMERRNQFEGAGHSTTKKEPSPPCGEGRVGTNSGQVPSRAALLTAGFGWLGLPPLPSPLRGEGRQIATKEEPSPRCFVERAQQRV